MGAAAAALLALLVAIVALKKCKNDSKMKAKTGSDMVSKTGADALLSFKKREFSWAKRVKKDGAMADFDLFTGPLVCEKNGKIVMKAYDMVIVDDAFPLYLAEIRPKPYRLKIEGYSQSKDDGKVTVMFKDIETSKYGECAAEGRNETLQLRVKSAELREREQNGTLYEFPMVQIYDEIAKRDFILTDEQKLIDGEYVVVVKDTRGNEYIFSEIGKSIRIGEASCVLRSLNRAEESARLLLRDATGQEFNKTVHLIR
ncbi:MAG: hypothetical protein LBI61_00045 [Puniceicoccales bacterium]|jgi:hypothetical protein|nr:hypothetical protein [Puniceicoccales bacterium]